MIRLLFTALLCALTSSQATAENRVSEALLALKTNGTNPSVMSAWARVPPPAVHANAMA